MSETVPIMNVQLEKCNIQSTHTEMYLFIVSECVLVKNFDTLNAFQFH